MVGVRLGDENYRVGVWVVGRRGERLAVLVMVGMGDVWVRGWRWGVVVIRAGVRVGIMACSGVGFWLELGFDEKVTID